MKGVRKMKLIVLLSMWVGKHMVICHVANEVVTFFNTQC